MPKFSQQLFDKICERLEDGESLRSICREADMPSTTSVKKWLQDDSELAAQYARARETQGDRHFERVCEIVDKVESKELDPQQARTMIDALKWTAGKLRPKVYGDKLAIGGDADNPLVITSIERRVVKSGD